MKIEFSLYLDIIRLFASLLVVLYHSANIYDPGGFLFTLGHEAVVIFFVLSGYVIAYISDTKEKKLKDYAASRVARIYSVALPAILLTMLVDQLGFSINLAAYPEGYQAWDHAWIRALSSLFFLNEFWLVSIQSFSNLPYWSLNYEVWYYVTFALVTYVEGHKRWALLAFTLLILGPKILMLMPIWWLGIYIYHARWSLSISPFFAYWLLIGSVLGFTLFINHNLSDQGWNLLKSLLGAEIHEQLTFSRNTLSDYLLAILVATHFVAINILAPALLGGLKRFQRPIRYFSSFTFAGYLFHQPLLLFFKALFLEGSVDLQTYLLILGSTLITIWLLGHYTEKQQPVLKKALKRLLYSQAWDRLFRLQSPAKELSTSDERHR